MKKRLKTMLLALVAIMMPIGAWAYYEPEPVEITLGESGIATCYYGDLSLEIPEGISASIITGVEKKSDGTVTVTEEPVTEIIPAGCAVILRGDEGTYTFQFTHENESSYASNLLLGTDEPETPALPDEREYLYFTLDSENEENSASLKDWSCVPREFMNKPHKAYLALPVEGYPELAAMLGALENPHLQHTHGGCEICGQVTEVSWGASADDLTSYGTLDDAINAAAAEENSTVGYIQLLKDVEIFNNIYGGTFTLDLNGHTIGASDESHVLQIGGANTHVTLKGETEGSMVFANGESSLAVYVIDGASVTIESGTYTSYYNNAVNNDADCSVTIIDGTFESTGSHAIDNCGDLVIKGGTFTSSDGLSTIRYLNGSINLSEYDNITDISISSWIAPSFIPSDKTILLPEGYCFFDSEGDPVGAIMYSMDYSIGDEPETKYAITFAAGDGEGEMADGISYGKYSLPECTFTAPEGMEFKAWQVGEDEFKPGVVVTIEDDATITAVWAELFEVSFDANEGTGSMDAVTTFSDFTLPECTFTAPEGMVFKAWQIGDEEYQPYETIIIEDDATITAVWAELFEVSFDANGGTGSMDDILTIGNCILPECTFTAPEGMGFKAWQVGETEYQPGVAVTIEDDATITALWATLFEVSFDANGGTGSMDAVTTFSDFTLPECTFTTPEGMGFKAWQVGETEYQPGEIVTIEKNTTITAVWAKLFEVSFDANGGTGSMDDILTISDCTLPECPFTAPEGKMFKAWQIGDKEYQPYQTITIEENTNITAVWTAYVPQIVIKMYDSANDGWHGDAIVVKKNGKEIGTATIEYGADGIVRYDYDNTADYTFFWQYTEQDGRWPDECSFEILIDDEEVFAAVRDEDEGTYDCSNYEDGDLICTIEHTACPHTSFSDGVCEECGMTGGYCGAETNEGGVESVRWAISEDGSTLTILGEGAMADYKGNSNNPWWRKYCQKITTIVISDGISRIGNDAFGDLDGITDIVIPSSVTTIGSNAFYGCSSLNTVTLNKGLCVIEGNAFVQCKVLTTITIPDGVTEIGVNAFNYCSNLASINIPHSVTTIGQYAFTANISTVYVSCSPQFEYTFGANTTVVYAEHEYEDGFCTVCGKFDGRINDGEHESFYVEENFENVDITYTRTLPNLMWNALYVPFEIPLTELAENYDVAYINDIRSYDNDGNGEIDDMTMEIIRINSGTLNANHPYLIRAKNEEAQNMEIVLSDATLYNTEEISLNCSSMYMEFTITGTYNTLSDEDLEEKYAISTSGAWQKLNEGSSLKPFRLYMEMTPRDGSPVKVEAAALSRIRINMQGEDENTTGVEILEAPQSINDAVLYDLYGRKVTTPVKGGIYISNGKKVIVK